MDNKQQYVNLEEGGLFVFDKWLKIGMTYDEVMNMFAEHIEHHCTFSDTDNRVGGACITLKEVEIYGFLFKINIFFRNHIIYDFRMRIIPNNFKDEAAAQGMTDWYKLLEYVAEKFNDTVKNNIGEKNLIRSGKTICYKNENYIFVGAYDRDMIMYEVVLGVK